MKISKGCPQYFRSVSNEKYRRVVLRLFRVLKLFPSVRTDVVKHYNTLGIHRSFQQGVVS